MFGEVDFAIGAGGVERVAVRGDQERQRQLDASALAAAARDALGAAVQRHEAVVEEDLTREGASHNAEILEQAKVLLDLIAQRAPNTAEVVGVNLMDIKGASLRIADVLSSGTGVSVAGADIGGDISIQGVRAGQQGERRPNG